jgi:polysaccharide biosynthesis protein PelF
LEGFAAGIPAVATDVGACRELIEGRTEEDKKLGASGLIVEIANPRAMANGIVEMIENTKHWQQAQQSALERIKKFYSQTQFVESYSSIYQKALASWQE